ncbi:MAG TPA: PhzF family phenazine biosynthesis protein [Thauera sp.]|uniref:PhzF family phenazine biosynthesis protein n=1 Tax=Thauera sp. TaxID=1905334 RepID=UPI002B64D5EB|nr:PhzF family phenazine biosynthesis protein [Thauera sp.]HRP23449.1 PhzF family phenazine biosynthesis protein [Thauera sp.]HRP65390.1 PhzF family phenazine biosynthesis protein [Thauera sp.]
MNEQLYRLAAFSTSPAGGNPAGVWLGEALPDAAAMQRIAAELGYSETAFVAPLDGNERHIRYYSPLREISFCGHATIAAGVVLGQTAGAGRYRLQTAVGEVLVEVFRDGEQWLAALTSVEPEQRAVPPGWLERVLEALDWRPEELDPALPPMLAYAGAWHLVLAAGSAARLARLDYDVARLKALMEDAGLVTLQLVYRKDELVFHARNPFPVGGVVEDPATGAAAAALGGYLRAAGLMPVPGELLIRQGEAMGRPSELRVRVPATGGIRVSGAAVAL